MNSASSFTKYNTNSDIFLNLLTFKFILLPNFPSNLIVSVAVFEAASEKSVLEVFVKIFKISGVLSKFSGFESIKILFILTNPVNFKYIIISGSPIFD